MRLMTVTVLAAALCAGGCSVEQVHPWDRDLLAQPQMQLQPDPLDSYYNEHIYFSKEASFGGPGIGGGGCGCN